MCIEREATLYSSEEEDEAGAVVKCMRGEEEEREVVYKGEGEERKKSERLYTKGGRGEERERKTNRKRYIYSSKELKEPPRIGTVLRISFGAGKG